MNKNNGIKISIIMPTNGKRPEWALRTLKSLEKQSVASSMELVIVSEGESLLKRLNYRPKFPAVKEIVTPRKNGIFFNDQKGAAHASGEYILFTDDDILYTTNNILENLVDFLEKNPRVWAIGPFIDEEKGSSRTLKNRAYNLFKHTFKLWDPDDYTNKIYSCFGKGSAVYKDNLPKEPHVGCQWLPTPTLLIRNGIYQNYYREGEERFQRYYNIRLIWAIDFFLTYKLYLKNKDALAFYPGARVIHLGAEQTSFEKRIIRETICGYYYYHRYFSKESFFKFYILPNIGRFFDIVFKRIRSPLIMVRELKAFFASHLILLGYKDLAEEPRPHYAGRLAD
jgi:glycosyltransferase involved in cell wall biosynthesis